MGTPGEDEGFAERGQTAEQRPHSPYRSRHSTNPFGASSRTIKTRWTRSSRSSAAAATRAASMVG